MAEIVNFEEARDEMREAIRAQMKRRKVKGKPLAVEAGLGESAVRDIFAKVDDPRISTILRLAHALQVTPATLIGGTVAITGTINEDGEIKEFLPNAEEAERVPRPPEAVGELLAYKVATHGLMPAYRLGDVVYVARNHEGVKPEYYGWECVVELAGNSAILLRTIEEIEGSKRFNLSSFNRPTLRDKGVVWAAPVLFVMRHRP